MDKFKFIILILVSFLSCNEQPVPNDEPNNESKDEIIFHDFEPNIEMHTVNSYSPSPIPLDCSDIPNPSDSAIEYYFDFNSDNINDFVLNISHSYYDDNYCGHCAVYTYSITIKGLSLGDSVVITDYQSPIAKFYNIADTILFNNKWGNYAQIELLEGCALPFHTDFTEGYIALKTDSNLVYLNVNKMQLNGISINSYAINTTKGHNIICGQTE